MEVYLTILGLKAGATPDEIKLAYRALVKIHHPDKPTGNEEKFKEIDQAYRILVGQIQPPRQRPAPKATPKPKAEKKRVVLAGVWERKVLLSERGQTHIAVRFSYEGEAITMNIPMDQISDGETATWTNARFEIRLVFNFEKAPPIKRGWEAIKSMFSL